MFNKRIIELIEEKVIIQDDWLIFDSELGTRKIKYIDFKNLVLNNSVLKSMISNDLEGGVDKVLSAEMGHELKRMIETIELIKGDTGEQGIQGIQGIQGEPNVLKVGTVETLPAGSSASATITGISPSQTLSLKIPQGNVGSKGDKGDLGGNYALADDFLGGTDRALTAERGKQLNESLGTLD
ncbi:MAG: hypothetical protein ACRCZL_05790, partial [Cetobacterium sp.]